MVKYGTLIELKGCKPTPPCFPQIGFRENLQETPRIWALNPWFLGPRSSLKPIKVWDDLENQGPTPPHPQVQRQTVPLKPKRQQLWHHPVALQALQGEIMGYDGIWWDMLGYDGMTLPLVLKISIHRQEQQRHNDVVVILDSNYQLPRVLVAMAIRPTVYSGVSRVRKCSSVFIALWVLSILKLHLLKAL